MNNDELREKFKTLMLATNEYCQANFQIHEFSGKYYDWCLQAKWEGFLLGYELGTTAQEKIKPETQEPEWRPMIEAPKDKDIKVKLNGEVRIAWYFDKEEWSVSGCIFHESYFQGWRPL